MNSSSSPRFCLFASIALMVMLVGFVAGQARPAAENPASTAPARLTPLLIAPLVAAPLLHALLAQP